MKHEKIKVTRIIDELVNYFLNLGCIEIDINIKDYDRYYEISFMLNRKFITDYELCKLKKLLSIGKQEEMEEYYWSLAGDCDVDTELTIVGIMSDRVIIEEVDDNNIRIIIQREK